MELTQAENDQLINVKRQMSETFESHKAHFEYLFPGKTLAWTLGLQVKEIEAPPTEDEALPPDAGGIVL